MPSSTYQHGDSGGAYGDYHAASGEHALFGMGKKKGGLPAGGGYKVDWDHWVPKAKTAVAKAPAIKQPSAAKSPGSASSWSKAMHARKQSKKPQAKRVSPPRAKTVKRKPVAPNVVKKIVNAVKKPKARRR